MKRSVEKIIIAWVIGFFSFSLACAEVKKVTYETSVKSITGKVAAISPNMLSLVYGQDPKKKSSLEMAMRMSKVVKIEGKNGAKKIDPWETVSVTYEETNEVKENELGVRTTRVKERLVKFITYLSPAPDFASMKEPGR